MNIRIATTRALALKDDWFKDDTYDLSPGSHFLEIKKIKGVYWLLLEGRTIGLPLKEWRDLKNKGVIPKSFLARVLI